jgi:NDP-sugar pyrophosphorylase family protein
MKVLILAEGFGSRLSEETTLKPKPMVEIGGKTIIWHIMKTYSSYRYNDLVRFHNSHDGLITMISVQPEGRFGALTIECKASRFSESRFSGA